MDTRWTTAANLNRLARAAPGAVTQSSQSCSLGRRWSVVLMGSSAVVLGADGIDAVMSPEWPRRRPGGRDPFLAGDSIADPHDHSRRTSASEEEPSTVSVDAVVITTAVLAIAMALLSIIGAPAQLADARVPRDRADRGST